jgi:uncharacterized protein YecE (DUF72 family)
MIDRYFIGTSGWHYPHWRNIFYPAGLAKNGWLEYYARHFNTVEINASFYRLPEEDTFKNWLDSVHPGFCFTVKVSRFITHIKRLKDVREPLEKFTGRARFLKDALGPLLYQLPSGMVKDKPRLEAFLPLLNKQLSHVIEFRHPSWINQEIFDLLRRYNTGFCISDMPGYSTPVVTTTDYAYFRFHGYQSLYSGNYPETTLACWADKIKSIVSPLKAVYVYFNNDASGFAIQNAMTLREFLPKNT